jgi:Putative prokaryotic signal transducing protein
MSNWREAISLTYPAQAHMVQGYLESEGIETMLKDELTTQVYSMNSNAIGGVKVMVRDEDYESAQQILEKGGYINPEKASKIETVYCSGTTNKKQCPFCHSENIGKKKIPDVIMLIIYLILGVIFPIFRRTDMCFNCGKEWVYKRQKNA